MNRPAQRLLQRQGFRREDWDLAARVLFRDSNLIVLDKPAGLAVHGGPQTTVHVEAFLEQLRFTLRQAPRLAHRLDRDTAGCLVLARHDKALSRLGRLFGSGKVRKTYWAVVSGDLKEEGGLIDCPLRKVTSRDGWRMTADPAGQAASTEWRCLGRSGSLSWLELHPLSGRTHQIRVHCASALACPIVGDPVYGGGQDRPMHLLARAVEIPYWADRPPIRITAPPPPHMIAALTACGWKSEAAGIGVVGRRG
jgi:tRNA pseudouridine32 synthase/23S rRNA pseudouridine746 synthase/23S rRNA pseudouridine1911/1915/1917 synthase